MSDVYIKLKKFFVVDKEITKKEILVKDICDEIICSPKILDKINNLFVCEVKNNLKIIINISKIIKILKKNFEDITIFNIGDKDIVISFGHKKKSNNIILVFLKVIIVCIILFFGAMTAIISFHNDSQLPKVFEDYKRVLFKDKIISKNLIIIPYSIGLATGVIVFFCNFNKNKISSIENQIELEKKEIYESSVSKFGSNNDVE
jgi:stage V sporulation protein AA